MKTTVRIASSLAVFLAPALALAQTVGVGGGPQTVTTGFSYGFISASSSFLGSCVGGIACVASMILYIINSILVPVLFAVAFLTFLYGIAKAYIFSHGEPGEVEQGHKLVLWGLIGFVVMVSLWGLVNVVANTFGLSGAGAPRLPKSY
jgi:hypothetical protein